MPRIITPESEEGKELAKWNAPRPHPPHPKMLYMARQLPNGKWSAGESTDSLWISLFGEARGIGAAEQFSRTCQRIVGDEYEERVAKNEGWRETMAEALEHHEKLERFVADAAAHRNFEDRNMSELAKAEIASAEAETMNHVAEVPEKPKRGRPRKIVAPPAAS